MIKIAMVFITFFYIFFSRNSWCFFIFLLIIRNFFIGVKLEIYLNVYISDNSIYTIVWDHFKYVYSG